MTHKERLAELEQELSNKLDTYIELRDELCKETGHCSTLEADHKAKESHNATYFHAKESYLEVANELYIFQMYLKKNGIDLSSPCPHV